VQFRRQAPSAGSHLHNHTELQSIRKSWFPPLPSYHAAILLTQIPKLKFRLSIESVTGHYQRRPAIGHIKTLPGTQLRPASSFITDLPTRCSKATHTQTCSHAGSAK